MKLRGTATLAAALCLGWVGLAAAQDAETIKKQVGAPVESWTGSIGGDMNFGKIGEDWYATLNLGLTFDFGIVGFGIQAPLRLLMKDNDPENNDYGGVLRREDWDEWTDYLKIIRYFRFGHKGELVFLQLGDLPGVTIGHASIVNRYYNNTDLAHFKLGVTLDVNTDYAGVETLLNNAFVSNLIGGRVYLKPFSFWDKDSYLNNFAIGFTAISDYAAPYCPDFEQQDTAGGPWTPGGACMPAALDHDPATFPNVRQRFDEDMNIVLADKKAATVLGGDLEFKVLNLEWINLTPYVDLNGIIDGGFGFHGGIMTNFNIPVISVGLQTRIEYRWMERGYIPSYFDSFYEIQKFNYPFKDENGRFGPAHSEVTDRPKAAVVEELAAQEGKGLNGYYAELAINVNDWVVVGGSYDDYDGPYNSNLRMYLTVPAFDFIKFGAYYYRHNFEGAGDAFDFDEKSLFLAEARYQIISFLYVVGQYWRVWRLDEDPTSASYGDYVATDDWSIGVGAAYNF
ncbi:MAG TPA: hypothetical protein PK668_02240 [Myxococcota bacterium]|nr:hypothetical protein [Myxococcota bacterium]HRY94612.1 hypothetical protein [Myxococcota bacterium]HSA20232.1 hypothetical protein [Myxococcota bacterium]